MCQNAVLCGNGLTLYHITKFYWSKFKAHAHDKINVTQNLNFVLGRVENISEKGENAGPAFSPFPEMFSKGLFFMGW